MWFPIRGLVPDLVRTWFPILVSDPWFWFSILVSDLPHIQRRHSNKYALVRLRLECHIAGAGRRAASAVAVLGQDQFFALHAPAFGILPPVSGVG